MFEMAPCLSSKGDDENRVQNDSEPLTEVSDWDLPLCFHKPRHIEVIKGSEQIEHSWRLKEKYKTHCVALVMCLNVGVDPPDVVKTQPCARLESWIDPLSLSPSKALESIGHNLQLQYERWQPRARYKQSLDPTSDEVKKLCCSLRRNAKDERVLFHYNGHGVPKPTTQGEIWVFNRAYTQYIPLSMYDLQTWMGAPSLYVYDCSNAGVIVQQFKKFALQHDRDFEVQKQEPKSVEGTAAPVQVSFHNCIQLAACAAGQSLPMNPELPADLFTACLTTPVKMAMKWFVLRSHTKVTPANVAELIDKIPGQVTDRRTMLGELNWIFTAITDTIAWNSLTPELFQQLFRADLLTASLCRNFLLADRIMRSYNCTPVSSPTLPTLANHPMWQAWDQTLDLALAQLPDMLGKGVPYKHSPFFKEQLTAFQVWLDLGDKECVGWHTGSPQRPPPDQLPMVLQVLLSTLHRVRALHILCRFLALGAWAVRAVLAVGIFPYMLKLLQASAHDLRASMVYIWAKIIAVDPSCQADLVNAKGHRYFLSVLQDITVESEHRTLAAYVLAGIVDNYRPGQEAALQVPMISVCLEQLNDSNPVLRQWLAICLGRLWKDYDEARWSGVRDLAHEKLYRLLEDINPEVRAAGAFALGTFVQGGRERSEHANTIDQQVAVTVAKLAPLESSPLVRGEILAALQWLVLTFEPHFIAVSLQEPRSSRPYRVESGQDALDTGVMSRSSDHIMRKVPSSSSIPTMAASLPTIGFGSVYMKLWSTLCTMCKDPSPQVAVMGNAVVNYIKNQLDNGIGRDFVEVRSTGSSSSLPPSPNTRGTHMSHPDHTRTLPPLGNRKVKQMPNTISEDSTTRDTASPSTSQHNKKPIITTQYVQWASSQFGRSSVDEDWQKDDESRLYQERKWRYNRNKALRKEAKLLRGARVSRLETQAFHARCLLPPAVIMFHPYDQHIAVASKDNFGIWDWGTGAKLCMGSWRRAGPAARVTSMAYLNAHDQALLAVTSNDGSVGIFRPPVSGQEPQLVSSWSGLDVRPSVDYRPPPGQPIYAGVAGLSSASNVNVGTYTPPPPGTLLSWCSTNCTLAVAGDASCIRLWDAQTELKLSDINTDTEAAVTALWRGAEQLVVGCSRGGVRAWDERAPSRPAYSHHDHQAAVLCVRLRPDLYTLVTGCVNGEVRLYDTRQQSMVECVQAAGPVAAMDVHPLCNLLACGSSNQCIGVYNLQGTALNTIKFHEGFMGARIGPVSCLAFHPLRCVLAVGAKDSTVSVYSSDARR